MTTAIRKALLGRGGWRFCAALLVVALLTAGAGAGHAAPQMDGQAHSAAASPADHHGGQSAAAHHQRDCHDPAGSADTGSSSGDTPSKHGAMHGCCANACFPGFTTTEFGQIADLVKYEERPAPLADQTATSRSLDGLFRPPKQRA